MTSTATENASTITVQTPPIKSIDSILQHIPAEEFADLYKFLQETFHDLENDPCLSLDYTDADLSLKREPLSNPEEEKEKCIVATTTTKNQTTTHKQQPSKIKNYEGFHEYIKRYYPWSTINGCNQANLLKDNESEDLCFICKDGGDLVLCDFPGCKKVYDRRLFPEDDDSLMNAQQWICPRHYCTGCNCTGSAVKYICMLCPFSSCKECVSKYESHNGWTIMSPNALNPHDIALNDYLQDVTWITCHYCTRELDERIHRRTQNSIRYMNRYSYLEQLDMSRRINICVEGAKPPLMKRQRLY